MPFRVSFAFSKLLYYKKIAPRLPRSAPAQRASNVVRTLAWGVKQKSGVRPQPGRADRAQRSGWQRQDGARGRPLAGAGRRPEVINRVVWSAAAARRCTGRSSSRVAKAVVHVCAAARTFTATASGGLVTQQRLACGRRSPRCWAWVNALDLALLYQWRVRLPLPTGKVVICDRYVARRGGGDRAPAGRGDPMSLAAVRVLVRLAPKPRRRVSAGRAGGGRGVPLARPGRRRRTGCAAARCMYRSVARALQMRLLDVSGEFAEANDRLVREVLQEYEDNFATFTNGLFLSNPEPAHPARRPNPERGEARHESARRHQHVPAAGSALARRVRRRPGGVAAAARRGSRRAVHERPRATS